MKRFKDFLLRLIGGALYFSGISPLICLIYQKTIPTVRILLYHRVPSMQEFEKQMLLVKKRYTVVSLTDIQQGNIKKRSLAVTFDDGYRDNYLNAYSVLKSHRIPATIFITTNYVGKESMLNWDEIREVSEGIVEIGGHTVSHKILSSINETEAEREIRESKRILETVTGKRILHFAYPKGKIEDYDNISIELVRKSGFNTASSTRRGLNKGRIDLFQLRRTPVEPDEQIKDFRRKLKGYWDFLFLRDFIHRQ